MTLTSNKKFKIVTLGCRTNQYESQAFRDQLLAMGYEAAGLDEEAELCIVNTCTVTESADSTSRHEIRKLAQENPETQILVTGCSAERQPEQLVNLPRVARVVPNKDKEKLLQDFFPDESIPEFAIRNFEAHTRAFVKVQDGCNSFCTYCIIPYVRGRSRSRTVDEILKEVRDLIANGYKEVVLTGINIGDFDGQGTCRLADLVRAVDQVEGLERLRISSIDPDEIDHDLLSAVLEGRTTCRSMHVVLQSGSNVVLKRMNRKYTRQIFMDTVERLRKAAPDFTFTTDVIVGFPGETDFDFQETIDVMRTVRFAKVHMFPYSVRPRTRAALFPNRVPQEKIKERKQEVLRVAEQIAFDLREEYIGTKRWVLTERSEEGWSFGHTDNFLPVTIPEMVYPSNTLVHVNLVANTAAELIGKI